MTARKMLTLEVTIEEHKLLRRLAAEKYQTMRDLLMEALRNTYKELGENYGKK